MKKVLFLILLSFSFSLFSYVVYLKDGSTYTAKEKYRVENGKAIITLMNGTIISIDLNLIDIKKTEEYNKGGIDSAIVLDDVKQTPSIPKSTSKPSLGDIAKPKETQDIKKITIGGSKKPVKEKTLEEGEKLYDDEVVRKAIAKVLDNVYLFEHQVLMGSTPDSVKIIVVTDNEKDVFSSLTAIAKAISELYDSGKKSINYVEIYLKTIAGAPAGRFKADIPTIRNLAEGNVTPQQFYVKYVLF
ncbi:MAG: hypothetical protein WHV67_05185 [Thermoanaerobaculia bacterium]